MAEQVFYKDKKEGKVLSFDYNLRFLVFTDYKKGQRYFLSVEEVIPLIQQNGKVKALESFLKEFQDILKDFEKNGRKENQIMQSLKHKPLVRVNDSLREFSLKGLRSLVEKKTKKNTLLTQQIVNDVLYVLYVKYFKKGDIPNLSTIKKLINLAYDSCNQRANNECSKFSKSKERTCIN